MKKFRKIITVALAAITAVSAMSMTAIANEEQSIDDSVIENRLVLGGGAVYVYGQNETMADNWYLNEDHTFEVDFNSSKDDYESVFGVKVNKSGQAINFTCIGNSQNNRDEEVIKISLYDNVTNKLLTSRTVYVARNDETTIRIKGLSTSSIYYIVVEPKEFENPFSVKITTSKG